MHGVLTVHRMFQGVLFPAIPVVFPISVRPNALLSNVANHLQAAKLLHFPLQPEASTSNQNNQSQHSVALFSSRLNAPETLGPLPRATSRTVFTHLHTHHNLYLHASG